MEPEILVPMTSSKAKQFVLIGDHKQLQPIVHDKLAKNLGLEISMFERLAKQAIMLKIQYRMVSCADYDIRFLMEGIPRIS
jgi:superfamily I DNA and/or RNA helicase